MMKLSAKLNDNKGWAIVVGLEPKNVEQMLNTELREHHCYREESRKHHSQYLENIGILGLTDDSAALE